MPNRLANSDFGKRDGHGQTSLRKDHPTRARHTIYKYGSPECLPTGVALVGLSEPSSGNDGTVWGGR
jgi:hypothetical protein